MAVNRERTDGCGHFPGFVLYFMNDCNKEFEWLLSVPAMDVFINYEKHRSILKCGIF